MDNNMLVVDPGGLTTDFVISDNIIAIVITHEHSDHFNPDMLSSIFEKNPTSILVSLASITEKMPDHKSQSVSAGDTIAIGPFTLEFFGGKHAKHHDQIPILDNIGVLINDVVYYPGDSFALPHKTIDILALPVGAPWLKIGETIDFLSAIKPRLAFPTHDAVLSNAGKAIPDRLLPTFAKDIGTEYRRIDGLTIEI